MVGRAIQEKEQHLLLNLGVVANEKAPFKSPSTTVRQFIYIYIYVYVYSVPLHKQDATQS